MLARRDYIKVRFGADCRRLVEFLDDAPRMYEACGYDSVEAYIRNGLELEPEEMAHAKLWLEYHRPEAAVGLGEVLTMARAEHEAKKGLPEQKIGKGKPGPGRGKKTGDDITRLSDRGTSPSYLARRLIRDHPKIFERLEAGEFRSIHQAALEAGIVRPTVSVPADDARKAIERLVRVFGFEKLEQAFKEMRSN
jgi:hypothetical protein